jgi:nucleoside-diphosphate-sugar epimerase
MPTKILLTGASGFLGRALVNTLSTDSQFIITAAARTPVPDFSATVRPYLSGDINAGTDWSAALGTDVVVHTAGRVHVMNDQSDDPLALFREVNTAGTLNLARQAASAGAKRFIFISTIKVNGEATVAGKPFFADGPCLTADPYALSKYEAEQGLVDLGIATGMEIVIIRPVLVYGPGVKANFHQLMRILRSGIPVPLGAVNNSRSLVGLDNLIDLIRVCITHPAAANQTFLTSDGEDLSTTELAQRIVKFSGSRTWLVPVPDRLIYAAAKIAGRESSARRVLGTLEVDINKTRTLLDWSPPVSVDQGLKRTVDYFMNTVKR